MPAWTSVVRETARDAVSGTLGAWIDERGSVDPRQLSGYEARPSSYDAPPPLPTRVLVRAVAGTMTFGLRIAARAVRLALVVLGRG